MGTTNAECEIEKITVGKDTLFHPGYTSGELAKFGPAVLGLGNIAAKSKQTDVVAAAFDLSGFTSFCSQVDPHLSLPKFLNSFLGCLFGEVRSGLEIKGATGNASKTYFWTELPFFAKFMGDGVLFLWSTENMTMTYICNIVVILRNICFSYSDDFVPRMKKYLTHVPKRLRCGIARGLVCSVGNGEDYVGPCINIASRLQKLSNLRICVSIRGIDIEEGMIKKTARNYVVKSVSIRGIGEGELVMVQKAEFEKLSEKEKRLFKAV